MTPQQYPTVDNETAPRTEAPPVERIGLIFVHGIGEQRRFEHLDAEIRPLIDAINRRPAAVTVEIVGGDASTLHAEHDTWSAQPGAPVRAIVRDGSGPEKHLYFHEVWWADVNEAYSLKKQVRFWLWGLGIWLYPNVKRHLPGGAAMQYPHFSRWTVLRGPIVRVKLFFVSTIFLLAAASIGTLVFLAKRVLGLEPPNFVRVLVNYLGAVELYNQPNVSKGGFLDAFQEPPRVSIRRRMIRTIADVASQGYDRWYVFAHSLGSVVAYNGLMENAQALANYLDEARWQSLVALGLAGEGAVGAGYFIGSTDRMLPARPLWLGPKDVVFRDKLFKNFHGLLTYGSPLDKFAAIWRRLVPINICEPFFPTSAEWINVYDPTDPVAGKLEAFSETTAGKPLPNTILTPRNLGYRAAPWLLLSHLKYLPGDLADSGLDWVLSGNQFSPRPGSTRWLVDDRLRGWWARIQWLLVFVTLAVLATLMVPVWKASAIAIVTGMQKLLSVMATAAG